MHHYFPDLFLIYGRACRTFDLKIDLLGTLDWYYILPPFPSYSVVILSIVVVLVFLFFGYLSVICTISYPRLYVSM